jgi:hypothetical protein
MLLNLSEICSYNALRVRFQLIPLDARRIPQSGLRRICGQLRQVCGDVPTFRGQERSSPLGSQRPRRTNRTDFPQQFCLVSVNFLALELLETSVG